MSSFLKKKRANKPLATQHLKKGSGLLSIENMRTGK